MIGLCIRKERKISRFERCSHALFVGISSCVPAVRLGQKSRITIICSVFRPTLLSIMSLHFNSCFLTLKTSDFRPLKYPVGNAWPQLYSLRRIYQTFHEWRKTEPERGGVRRSHMSYRACTLSTGSLEGHIRASTFRTGNWYQQETLRRTRKG